MHFRLDLQILIIVFIYVLLFSCGFHYMCFKEPHTIMGYLSLARGDHTPLHFVTTCDNGIFNGGIFMHLSKKFLSLFVNIKLL